MAALPPILAVDDSPDDLFFLKRLLTRAGVKNLLITLEDGVQAKAFLSGLLGHPESALVPFAIYTDLNMPMVDGLELVKWIRKHTAFADIPLVMCSSSPEPSDEVRAKAAGVNWYFQKFPIPDLIARMFARFAEPAR